MRPRWAVVLVALLLTAACAWLVFYSPVFRVREILVDGSREVSSEQVVAAADIVVGTSMTSLPLEEITDRVERLDAVAMVDVVREWPSTVRISVVEQTPVAIVRTDAGFSLIGDDGAQFRPAASRPTGLPLLDPADGAVDVADAELTVATALPDSLRPDVVRISSSLDGRVTLLLRDGADVDWGTASASPLKAQALLALRSERSSAATYDVSTPEAPAWSG